MLRPPSRYLSWQRCQPYGFVAELAPDRLLGVCGKISFVEEQIEDSMHAGQP